MNKNKQITMIMCFSLVLAIFAGLLGNTITADARIMNVEKQGSLTIHKYLNPENDPANYENGWVIDGNINPNRPTTGGFQGDGTTDTPLPGDNNENTANGEMKPLPGAEFSVYGRLTTNEVNSLMDNEKYDEKDPKPLDTLKVEAFIKDRTPDYIGVTDSNGQVKWTNIPINTVDLSDNMYLVVETKTPISEEDGSPVVQLPSMPVLVNIPSTNPKEDKPGAEVNNYNYNVNLYLKNYAQTEPGIEKEIDKPTHAVGEEVKFKLTIRPLAFDIDTYEELIITDKLAPELYFYELGHTGGAAYLPLSQGDQINTNKQIIPASQSVVFYRGADESQKIILTPTVDYYVSHPAKNTNGTIRWFFTKEGIKKLTGVKANDGSRIELYFTALTNEKALVNVPTPNDAALDFQNKWGYSTKPTDNPPNPPNPYEPPDRPPYRPNIPPFSPPTPPGNNTPPPPTSTKPTEVVNTIFGERWFEKRDKQNNTLKLEGAEFLVRNRSTRPVTALDENQQMQTYPAGTTLYAIITNVQGPEYPYSFNPTPPGDMVHPWMLNNQYVVGWTPDWKKAYDNHWTITSDKNGQFHVQGLEYTNQVFFRRMYIFAEMAVVPSNGTYVEVVKDYHYILAYPRIANANQTAIQNEIDRILADHKGVQTGKLAGDGAWKFYKESEADPRRSANEYGENPTLNDSYGKTTSELFKDIPDKAADVARLSKPGAMIDYLGDEWNDYELIEVRAPEGYSPIETNFTKYVDQPQSPAPNPDAGTVTEEGKYDPTASGGQQDVFEHPLAFTVPGMMTEGLPNYGAPNYSGDLTDPANNVVPVPNAKIPKIPLTGGTGTVIFLVISLLLGISAFVLRRVRKRV